MLNPELTLKVRHLAFARGLLRQAILGQPIQLERL
jgi:hypothetical protein